METLKQIFMRRDNMTAEEADNLISEMREEVTAGVDPEEVLQEHGLEPDYMFELLDL
jgi:hypothetical protein